MVMLFFSPLRALSLSSRSPTPATKSSKEHALRKLTMRCALISGLTIVNVMHANADTYVVDTEIDAMSTGCSGVVIGDCTLRGAIERANQNPGLDTIIFGFGATSIALSITGADEDLNQTGDLDILEGVGIFGGGSVTVDGSLLGDRVFDVLTDTDDPTLFKELAITGGQAPPDSSIFSVLGGGIRCVNSALLLDGAVVAGNGPVGGGGGIAAVSCQLLLNFASIHDNSAIQTGGGIGLYSGSTMNAALSAVFDNAANHGGGLAILQSEVAMDNSTFSGNTGSVGSAIQNSNLLSLEFVTIVAPAGGSAIVHLFSGASTTLSNSLLVGDCDTVAGSTFVSAGGNLESPGDTCDLDPLLDQVNVADARLMPLGDYGGATLSHMPRADSPAVDDPLGATTNCPGYDQRFGPSRPLDGNGDGIVACDIGAIERDHIFMDGFESGDVSQWSMTAP